MKRPSIVLSTLAAGLLVLGSDSLAQPARKVWRVGFLSGRARPASIAADRYSGLMKGMAEFGHVEGKDYTVEWRFADGKYDRLPTLAAELVALPVDVIVADGPPPSLAAMKTTRTLPIVFIAGDPVATGLVKSLSRPGGNATGVSTLSKEVCIKQLEMLRSFVPGVKVVGVLVNPDNPYSAAGLGYLQTAATALALTLVPLEVRGEDGLRQAFARMKRDRIGAFTFVSDPILDQLAGQIARLEVESRVPGMGYARFGGLFYYGQNVTEQHRHAASYVDRILKGANPGEIPVEQPTKIELVINRKTAAALGLTIPTDLLVLADMVIE